MIVVLVTAGTLAVALLARLPVAFVLLAAGAAGLTAEFGLSAGSLIFERVVSTLQEDAFTAIAALAFAGELNRVMGAESGVRRLFQSMLAGYHSAPVLVPLLSSSLQGPLLMRSGRSLEAETAREASTGFELMRNQGLNPLLAWSMLILGGTCALALPPGYLMILLGVSFQESIRQLILAFVLPGLSLIILLILFGLVAARFQGSTTPLPPLEQSRLSTVWRDFDGISRQLATPFVLVIAISYGATSPTQAAAIIALAGFAVAWIQPIRPRFRDFVVTFEQAAIITAEFLFVIVGASTLEYLANYQGWSHAFYEVLWALPGATEILIVVGLLLPALLAFFLGIPAAIVLSVFFYGPTSAVFAGENQLLPTILIGYGVLAGATIRTTLWRTNIMISLPLPRRLWVALLCCSPLLATWLAILLYPDLALWLPSLID